MEVVYNPKVPIETFDFMIAHECRRTYYLWKQVLAYFRAFMMRLILTPDKRDAGYLAYINETEIISSGAQLKAR